MKLEFSRHIFEKSSFFKFHEHPPLRAELFHAERRTDMTKPIVVFRNFANALKKLQDISGQEGDE
jgi:hypothetical protein